MTARAWLLLLGACTADDGPRLDTVTPARAAHDAMVTLTGRRLCGPGADCASAGGMIQLGLDHPVQAPIMSYTDTTAQIVIPVAAPAGPTEIVVTVNNMASNSIAFEILP